MLTHNRTQLLETLDSVLRNNPLLVASEVTSPCEQEFAFELEKAAFLRPRLAPVLCSEASVEKASIATAIPTVAQMESSIVIELLPTTYLTPNRENSFIIEEPRKTDVTELWNELLTEIRRKVLSYSATSAPR